MVIGVKIPKMGQATVEVDVIAWHVSVGDTVVPGTVLAEIESEKTTIELESEIDGTVEEILVSMFACWVLICSASGNCCIPNAP